MFRSMSSRPAVFRMLRSSPVPARPPRRARHHTFRCLPLEQLENRSMLSTIPIMVTLRADSGPGTLRQAITMADAGATTDSYVITIEQSASGTILLKSVLPDLSRNITITGLGVSGVSTSTVQRDPAASPFRIFTVDKGATVNISGLTIKGGNAGRGTGGGLDNFGTLAVSNSVFSGDSAFFGGGLANFGTATVSGSSFTRNSAAVLGGGIYNNGTATVSDSTFTSNFAAGGGGLSNAGTATVSGSSFTSNSAGNGGGGLFNSGTATVSGSSFTSNSAVIDGGGLNNAVAGRRR